ncbi:MAG: divalent-cation tolerance protein CutA [archaeon]
MIEVHVTFPSKKEAENASGSLLEKKLAACTLIFPVESAYKWKGKTEKAKEFLMIAKSEKMLFARIKAEIKRLHSYETPFIAMLEAKANKEYEKWLSSELAK